MLLLKINKKVENNQTEKENEERVKCPTNVNVPYWPYEVQAEEMPGEMAPVSAVHENVEFMDAHPGDESGMDAGRGLGDQDKTTIAPLAEFLSRPVRICSYTWNETDPVGPFTTPIYQPWYLFFNNPAIKYKLNNYAWVRADLKLKVIVNASPFYYGLLMQSYRPIVGFNSDTIQYDAGSPEAAWIPRSQRPHIFVTPQDSSGGEMTLPFFYHKNWLDLQSAADMLNMGEVTSDVLIALQSANGASGVGVTIQVYAWAENVELSGPSLGLALQSDEYGEGPVSGVASAVAGIAGRFKGAGGLIGSIATATEIGANVVGGIASLFGFTNVPVIEDVKPVRPTAQPQLASTQIGYPAEKLTLDAKNELTVDPAAIGLPSTDSLDISTLAQRESILTTTNWLTTDAVDAPLFYAAVNPWMIHRSSTATQKIVNMPPMAWVANLFAAWRGDIIFRFEFVKSKYHRGRVAISYDPSGYAGNYVTNIANTSSMVYTKVVDIGSEDAVEIRVPYMQSLPYLRCNTAVEDGFNCWNRRYPDADPLVVDRNAYNGYLSMRVLNVLTAPVASSSIGIVVTVRAADNIEFANPAQIGKFSPFQVQSSEVAEGRPVFQSKAELVTMGATVPGSPQQNLVNFGETVSSLRQLLRRFTLNEVWWEPNDTTSALYIIQHAMSRFPVPYGFDPNGLWKATGPVSGSAKPFNWTFSTPYNWVAPAFVGQRGSMQWHFNINQQATSPAPVEHFTVTRNSSVFTSNATRTFVAQTAKNVGATTTPKVDTLMTTLKYTETGTALTTCRTNGGLTVQLPNYTRYLFQSTTPGKITAPSASDGGAYDTHTLEVVLSPLYGPTTRGLFIDKYAAIGTDFNLYWFLNAPSAVFYQSVPPQAT